ncbi:DNA-binding transcriptional ArsR family regulator [Desmospora activa DSM 45169]|uniref:DNA-binding transcriptional ArsR family regulator n=1 Tax=Desmospora activa DSM 45169 TaxID=1121389 RepID=A0A2T4Z6F7_9BACL|nr:DNA-binding transcriptional ArsR family regulator [Desmospora activa DSM 45169]
MYELIASLTLYLDKKAPRVTDLGKPWVGKVNACIQPELKQTLSQLMEQTEDAFQDKQIFRYLLMRWAVESPEKGSVDSFLRWLQAQQAEELYERIDWGDLGPLPLDECKSMQEHVLTVVEQWNQQYFQDLDPAILQYLRADAEKKRRLAEKLDPVEVVEQATKGIRVQPIKSTWNLVLIPQYHYAPVNILTEYRNHCIWQYAVELPPEKPEDPPRSLVRLSNCLGDANRLRILRYIAEEPRTFMEIVRYIGLAKSTVNHHLVHLRAAGLVQRDFFVDKRMERHRLREVALDQVGGQLREYLLPDRISSTSRRGEGGQQ